MQFLHNIKKQSLLAFFALLLFFAGITVFIQAGAVSAQAPSVNIQPTEEHTKARISLKSSQSLSDIVKMASEKGLKIELIEDDFTVGSLALYDFFFVKPDMDAKAIEEDYKRSRLAYFQDILKGDSELSQDQKKDLAPQFGELKAAIQRNDTGEIKVKKLTLSGSEKEIQTLFQRADVEQVSVIKEKLQSPLISPASTLQKMENKMERVNKKQAGLDIESTISSLYDFFLLEANAAQSLPSAPRYGISETKASSVNGQRETNG